MSHVQLSAWGLADEIVDQLETGPQADKYLIGRVGGERIAIADKNIHEVVDRPKVTRWLRDQVIAGVFALRGDVYALSDPLKCGEIRRIAVVLNVENRYLAVGLDEMTGVRMIADSNWSELESSELPWARRAWDDGEHSSIELDPRYYIESVDQLLKEQ